jgi:alpha-glucosidase
MISFALLIFSNSANAQNEINLFSPDSTNRILLKVYKDIQFEVWNQDDLIIPASKIDLRLLDSDGDTLLTSVSKGNIWIKKSIFTFTNELIYPEINEKGNTIINKYNELELELNSLTIVFRAYNNGIAWRYQSNIKNEITVLKEKVEVGFPEKSMIYFPEESSFFSHNERYYLYEQLDSISDERFCSLPALIEISNGKKILISESGLEDYPGMWLKGTGNNALNAIFPGVSLKEDQINDRSVKVSEYANYLAKTKGQRSFPWRILALAKNDAELISNQLTYQLAQACAIKDPSWIKPGKVAWDWWNANNIYGVDFKAGINTETYKYYIDFASKYGIEYIILDEGWYELGDLLKLNPEIDMEEIMAYGKEKNVGIILWVVWKTLWDQWDEAFDQIEEWGAKGIKVDFMQRDDQWMVQYYHKVAEEAAKRKLLVDFHGAYKPSGLRRKFPNVITREGVRGLEQSKWCEDQTPRHNVTLPFIRMVAGPLDYTPGAMINAQPENFEPIFNRPMSMGTRCHQLAMYVVYESPLQMLADNPSNYYQEPECMEFLSAVPTVWDSTIVISAKIADHILIARRKGNDWFIGGMTNENPKKLLLDLGFLENDKFRITSFEDGKNADRYASDFISTTGIVTSENIIEFQMGPGGGWAAWLKKVQDE